MAGAFSLQGTLSTSLFSLFSAPSLAYNFTVKLADSWIPATALAGPFEIDESLDTPAILFSITLTGRQYSIQSTATTWTATPIEVWATAGPIGSTRTWRRATGIVLTCEQLEGPEPTIKLRCGDPTRLLDRLQLCYEFPAGAGLTRGDICRQILTDAGFTPDIPNGALYTKPLITDSQRLWPFLTAFGEPEGWAWRITADQTIQAYVPALKHPPEAPDDIWALRDVLSVESAPPSDVPSQWVFRSTQITETAGGIQITKQRVETFDYYAIKKAVAMQNGDGTTHPLPGASAETFRRVSLIETEILRGVTIIDGPLFTLVDGLPREAGWKALDWQGHGLRSGVFLEGPSGAAVHGR